MTAFRKITAPSPMYIPHTSHSSAPIELTQRSFLPSNKKDSKTIRVADQERSDASSISECIGGVC